MEKLARYIWFRLSDGEKVARDLLSEHSKYFRCHSANKRFRELYGKTLNEFIKQVHEEAIQLEQTPDEIQESLDDLIDKMQTASDLHLYRKNMPKKEKVRVMSARFNSIRSVKSLASMRSLPSVRIRKGNQKYISDVFV